MTLILAGFVDEKRPAHSGLGDSSSMASSSTAKRHTRLLG
jgi:hypothetical protein